MEANFFFFFAGMLDARGSAGAEKKSATSALLCIFKECKQTRKEVYIKTVSCLLSFKA
jgi:hypothetical protein